MTRGNQRDTDRERALARAKAAAGGNSTLKSADTHTEALRLKQAAALARKEAERQAQLVDTGSSPASKAAPKELDEAEIARREGLRLAKEAAEAAWIQKQEEERDLKEAAKLAKGSDDIGGVNGGVVPGIVSARVAPSGIGLGHVTLVGVHGRNTGEAEEEEDYEEGEEEEEEEDIEPSGEQVLDELATTGESGRALIELDVSRALARLLFAHDSAAIAFLRQHSGAQVSVHRHQGGSATIVATGTVPVLQAVSGALHRLLDSESLAPRGTASDDMNDHAAHGEGEEYVLTYPPRDAKTILATSELPTVPLRYDVRQRTTTGSDGWLQITLRGASDALAEAQSFIDTLLLDEHTTRTLTAETIYDSEATTVSAVDNGGSNNSDTGTKPAKGCSNSIAAVLAAGGSIGAGATRGTMASGATDGEVEASLPPGVVRLVVPKTHVGRVIGRGGATMRELRESSGAEIDLTKDGDGVGTVTISGTSAAVAKARAAIREIIGDALVPSSGSSTSSSASYNNTHHTSRSNKPNPALQAGLSGTETETVHVPSARVGKLLGPKGSAIQLIRSETGAAIDLKKAEDGSAVVTIVGNSEAVRVAKRVVVRIAESTLL